MGGFTSGGGGALTGSHTGTPSFASAPSTPRVDAWAHTPAGASGGGGGGAGAAKTPLLNSGWSQDSSDSA
jgi:hypothetical protein